MMKRNVCFWIGILAVATTTTVGRSQDADQPAATTLATTNAPADENDALRLARSIDAVLGRSLDEAGIRPAPIANDATFLRRTSLDIGGAIPDVHTVRQFLSDTSPDKRQHAVDRLLNGPGYIHHFTSVFRGHLVPQAENDFQLQFTVPAFDAWIRDSLMRNEPYDEMVRRLLTAPVFGPFRFGGGQGTNPIAFYTANEFKAENLAGSVARNFLGVRIECAQCHDHPFDDWSRESFWGFASFFVGLDQERPSNAGGFLSRLFRKKQLMIPGTKQAVRATFLDGSRPPRTNRDQLREELAKWVTDKDNAYFAKAAVNRLWGQMFGVGIVDPVDDFSPNNPASHPELLQLLADQFVEHNFDVKFLVNAIAVSETYQRSSRGLPGQPEAQSFARMSVKRMSADQLVESLYEATGLPRQFDPGVGLRNVGAEQQEFFELFQGGISGPTERETTILQALALMNGRWVANATSLESSRTLTAVAEYPGFSTAERVDTLFLATLSRFPRPNERERFVQHVAGGEDDKDVRRRLGNVLWALLNSSEFSVNH